MGERGKRGSGGVGVRGRRATVCRPPTPNCRLPFVHAHTHCTDPGVPLHPSGYGNRILATSAYSHRWGGPEIRCPYAPIPHSPMHFRHFPGNQSQRSLFRSTTPQHAIALGRGSVWACRRKGDRRHHKNLRAPGSPRPSVPPRSTYHVQRTTRHSATPASRSSAEGPVMLTQTLTSCARLYASTVLMGLSLGHASGLYPSGSVL